MAETDLIIRLKLDKSVAERESKQYHDGERQRVAQTAQAGREAQRQFLAESRAASRARRDQITADAKAEREATSETAKANKAAQAEAKKGLKETSDALRKRITDENALKVVLTQQQTAERARLELTQQLNRKRIDSAKQVMMEENRHFKSLKESTDRVGDSTESLLGKYATLGATVGMVGAVGAAWQDVIEKQRQAFAEFNKINASARVGAGVSNKTSEQQSADILKLSVNSGLTFDQADELKRQYAGTVPIAVQKGNISEKVSEEVLAETAKTGARLGGDQGTRGELAGIIGQFGPVKSKEEGLSKLESVRKQLVDGRGDDGPLSRALLNAAPTLIEGGMVGSIEEAGALVGTMSLAGGAGQADTLSKQLARGVRGTTPKQVAALEREFGIKAGSTENLESRLDKMVPKLRDVKAKGGDVHAYLRDSEMSEENIEATEAMLPNYEAFKLRTKQAKADAANEDDNGSTAVMAANEKFSKSAPGRTMKADAKGQAGRYLQGERIKEFGAMAAEEQAGLDSQDPNLGLSVQSKIASVASYLLPGIGTQAESYANRDLQKQIEDRGLTNPYGGIVGSVKSLFTAPSEVGGAMIKTLKDADVDPHASVADPLTNKIVEGLDKVAATIEAGNKVREGMANQPKPLGPAVGNPPGARAGMR